MNSSVLLVVTINMVAVAVLLQRAVHMGMLPDLQQITDHFKTLLGNNPVQQIPPASYRICGLLDTSTFIFKTKRAVIQQGVRPAAILVVDGAIKSIEDYTYSPEGVRIVDYTDAVVSPGVIDVHAHLNEPGREHWEGVSTGTAAAAAGGVTTLVDMPLNSDPCTTTPELLKAKMAVGQAKAHVNMGYWGGITPDNVHDAQLLSAMVDAGALGFKSFMSPSGIDDFPNVSVEDVKRAIAFCKAKGVPYLVHAELVSDVEAPEGDPRQYTTWMDSRPPSFERDAIQALISALVEDKGPARPGFALHVAHLGDAGSVTMLQIAQRHKLPITVETCAHYLTFSAEDIPEGATQFKCAPPIRGNDNREGLIAAVLNGTITIVSSDHSPAPPEMKSTDMGDFVKAWGGISGLQYLLPAAWTALGQHGVSLVRLAALLSGEPARLAGLEASKGSIAVGKHADFVVWDPSEQADTSRDSNHHRHKLTPYEGLQLKGKVMATFVRGNLVYTAEAGLHEAPCGQVVTRPAVRSLQ